MWNINQKSIMKQTSLIIFILTIISNSLFGQTHPEINIRFSKLYAIYDFTQKLSDYYPDNEYKESFKSSKYNTEKYTKLITQLDTLDIHESYSFKKFPVTQKRSVMTISMLQKNLINSTSLEEFKSKTFGIVPSSELIKFSSVLSAFEPIYDSLIYLPNKQAFENKLKMLSDYVKKSSLSLLFKSGLNFYASQWDNSIPLDITIIPSKGMGFTATVFFNQAVSEVPLDFQQNDVLFSVLMHEVYHIQYDEQPLKVKQNLQLWFKENTSQNSTYAYLLLNEVLATALGNGYVFEQLNGKIDAGEWYNNRYVNLMAKEIYPTVKEYLSKGKTIDKDFVNKYISIYDNKFSDWNNELDNLMTYRYIVTDDIKDITYFNKNYRNASIRYTEVPVKDADLNKIKEKPITKVFIISSNNKDELNRIKNSFPELKNWNYNDKSEFVYTTSLQDKTKLIVINRITTPFIELFEKEFKNKRIK